MDLQATPSPVEQARALTHSAGVRVRDELAVVLVRGDDRATWLSGQITNDIRALAGDATVHALAVNVRGKILGELRVGLGLGLGEQCLVLFLAKSAQPSVLESFERFIIMEDVTLEPAPELVVISVQGPRARAVTNTVTSALVNGSSVQSYEADELGNGGMYLVCPGAAVPELMQTLRQQDAAAIDDDGFELARLRHGLPRFGNDFGETTYPQEAGLKAALSFSKGCYLGQEVVCTLENRGRLTRRLCVLHAPADSAIAIHDTLEIDGQACGQITSVVRDPENAQVLALGFVKRAHALPGATLNVNGTTVSLAAIVGDSA